MEGSMNRSQLEQELTNLPEIEVRPELCDRVMERISALEPAPEGESRTRSSLLARFLKNLSFVVAAVALVKGSPGTQWLRNILSFDLGLRFGGTWAAPFFSTSVGLAALACLLFLVSFALTEGTNSRSDVVTRRLNSGTS
jgi:hypothetical protein